MSRQNNSRGQSCCRYIFAGRLLLANQFAYEMHKFMPNYVNNQGTKTPCALCRSMPIRAISSDAYIPDITYSVVKPNIGLYSVHSPVSHKIVRLI